MRVAGLESWSTCSAAKNSRESIRRASGPARIPGGSAKTIQTGKGLGSSGCLSGSSARGSLTSRCSIRSGVTNMNTMSSTRQTSISGVTLMSLRSFDSSGARPLTAMVKRPLRWRGTRSHREVPASRLRWAAGKGDGPHRDAVGEESQRDDPHQERAADRSGEEAQRAANLFRLSRVERRDGTKEKPAHGDPDHAPRAQAEASDPEDHFSQRAALSHGREPAGEPAGDSLEDRDEARDDENRSRQPEGRASRGRGEEQADPHPLEVLAPGKLKQEPDRRPGQRGVPDRRDRPADAGDEIAPRRQRLDEPPRREAAEARGDRGQDDAPLRLAEEDRQRAVHPRRPVLRAEKGDAGRDEPDRGVEEADG